MLSDYSNVLGVSHDNPEPITDLGAGDLVTVGLNQHPVWAVIAVHAGKAWMQRTDADWIDGIAPIVRLHRARRAAEGATA